MHKTQHQQHQQQQQQHRLLATSSASSSSSLTLNIDTPEEMLDLGALLSAVATLPGDVILLDGDLGAGKTCLSRGFIQNLVGDAQTVTSPTYLLCNTYPITTECDGKWVDMKVNHMDLYRLSGSERDLMSLNLDQVFAEDISLIEWPQRLGDKLPLKRLHVFLEIMNQKEQTSEEMEEDYSCLPRRATLTALGEEWEQRIQVLQNEGYVDDWLVNTEIQRS